MKVLRRKITKQREGERERENDAITNKGEIKFQ